MPLKIKAGKLKKIAAGAAVSKMVKLKEVASAKEAQKKEILVVMLKNVALVGVRYKLTKPDGTVEKGVVDGSCRIQALVEPGGQSKLEFELPLPSTTAPATTAGGPSSTTATENSTQTYQVLYNGKTISDDNIKAVLQKIADTLEGDVNVTSGDRNYVPAGGSQTSLHLQKRAADLSVSGYSLKDAFAKLKEQKATIFDADKKYEVIRHGDHTATGGPHIHIGRFATGTGVSFKVEGLTEVSKGVYTLDN